MKIKEFKDAILGSYPDKDEKDAFETLFNIDEDETITLKEIKEALEEDINEYADELVNPYTSDLLNWYNEDLKRVYWGDEAMKGGAENFLQLLSRKNEQYNKAILSAYALYLKFVDKTINFTDFEKKVLSGFDFYFNKENNQN